MNIDKWLEVFESSELKRNPQNDVVFCSLIMQGTRGFKGKWECIKNILYCKFCGNSVSKVVSTDSRVVIVIQGNRRNEWDTLLPIAKELDRQYINYCIWGSDEFIEYHEKLKKEKCKKIYSINQIMNSNMENIKYREIYNIVQEWKKVKKIANSIGISFWNFLETYCIMIARVRGLYVGFLENCEAIISLGDPIYGMIYQMYGIKHYAIQHGVWQESATEMKAWPNAKPCIIYKELCWGESQKKMYKSVFDVDGYVVGNPRYASNRVSNNPDSKKIVFFSCTHYFRQVRMDLLLYMYEAMDFLLELYERLPDGFDIYIKLHPRETEEEYLKYNKLFGTEIKFIDGNVDSLEVLNDCKMALSLGETTTAEAAYYGIFAGQIMGGKVKKVQNYAYQIENVGEVVELIHNRELFAEIVNRNYELVDEDIHHANNAARNILVEIGMIDE